MSTTRRSPARLGARQQHAPELCRAERHRQVGADRGAGGGAGLAVHAARHVDGNHGRGGGVHADDRGGVLALRLPAEPGAEDRVDHDVCPRELARKRRRRERPDVDASLGVDALEVGRGVAAQVVGRREQYGDGRDARALEVARGDEPVAGVVAPPAHDHRPAAVPPAGHIEARARHGRAGALHQQRRRRAGLLGAPVERRGLRRGEHRLHASVTATANATAFVFSWVKVISTRVIPSASARRFALPAMAMCGAPLGCRVTLMSCQRFPR